jgi:hypothetical protein
MAGRITAAVTRAEAGVVTILGEEEMVAGVMAAVLVDFVVVVLVASADEVQTCMQNLKSIIVLSDILKLCIKLCIKNGGCLVKNSGRLVLD